ncbi:hypothetical protein CBR_g704 [Chara braunii]|uniref:Uncharacterized protein n=1 Tax=Chara braunii TaxID=69332 RepID=A0A388KBY8_CHABU|nr:hypothetical protein CBR_g704 [Chara braunii]|eukprot:GBG67575.1 hypothetical protein CBR_g704 [Chara braunii]
MNTNLADVSMPLDDDALETTVVRMHPKQTDAGLELTGVEGCGQVTTFDKADGSSPLYSAEGQIDPKPGDVSMPHDTSGNEMRAVDLDQRLGPGYEDLLYSGLHGEAMGEDLLKKASDTVEDKLFYLSDDDEDTVHEDKKLRGEELLFDIHGTLSPTQYDTVAMEKTQPVNVVDLDALSSEKSGLKLFVADVEDLRHREEFMSSPIIDADTSNLSSFPDGLEHVIAVSTRRGLASCWDYHRWTLVTWKLSLVSIEFLSLLSARQPVLEVLFCSLLPGSCIDSRQLNVIVGVHEVLFASLLLRSCVVSRN